VSARSPLPRLASHDERTRSQIVFSSTSIAAAVGLLGVLGFRLATHLDL
jgi:hypothetical protein